MDGGDALSEGKRGLRCGGLGGVNSIADFGGPRGGLCAAHCVLRRTELACVRTEFWITTGVLDMEHWSAYPYAPRWMRIAWEALDTGAWGLLY